MFNNSSKIMFLMILMMGTLITISSNSWLGAWMGLEINLLSFIPLMSDNNLMSTEASLKYFLTQALASAILLFSIMMLMLNSNLLFMNNNFITMMLLSTLLLKSGAAPFHFWFPNLMEGLSWMNGLILMTWQKLAPLILISYTIIDNLLWFSIICSVLIGAIGGLNQTSLRKLMAFSSINHLGWMLSAMQMNQSMWLMYFSMYTLLSFNLIYFFNLYKISHMNQLFSMYFISKTLKMFFLLNFLSLGGLPPFLGFFPKWMVIQFIVINNEMFLLMVMMMTALITLFYYLRICYSAFMLNYSENNWINMIYTNKIQNYFYLLMTYISIFGMTMLPMFYLL